MDQIYFDYGATTPCDPLVVKAMEPYFFERFGNASSPHESGRTARKALEDSREILARFLGSQRDEIIFTSGATESNNQAVFGAARAQRKKGNHIIISKIEHHSVFEPVEFLKSHGYEVSEIDVDENGVVDLKALKAAVKPQTILIAVIHANNEIGSLQPISQIGAITQAKHIPFLVDAVQTVGHIPVDVDELNADFLSLAAHKFYGPKGVGALYARRGTPLARHLLGGDQERGWRASTQNVAGVVGLAKAIELCEQNMAKEAKQQAQLRDRLLAEVPQRIQGVKINGHRQERLSNNAHFSFAGVKGEALLMALDRKGIAASMGSACTSGAIKPSRILKAIGLSNDLALGSLRITLGRWTTTEHIDRLLEELPLIIERLRTHG